MLPQQIHVGHGVLEFCLRFVEHVGAVFLVGGFVVEPRHNGLHGSAERDAARAGYRGDEIHHVSFQMRRDNTGLRVRHRHHPDNTVGCGLGHVRQAQDQTQGRVRNPRQSPTRQRRQSQNLQPDSVGYHRHRVPSAFLASGHAQLGRVLAAHVLLPSHLVTVTSTPPMSPTRDRNSWPTSPSTGYGTAPTHMRRSRSTTMRQPYKPKHPTDRNDAAP